MTKLLFIVLLFLSGLSLFSQEVGDTLWTYNFNNDGVNINGAIFTPDGQYIYANGGAWLYKFDLSGKIVSHELSPTGIWPIMQFSKDGRYFWDKLLNKYDALTFKKIDSLKNHNPKSNLHKWVINEDLNIGLIVHGFEAYWTKDKHFEIFDPTTMTVTKLVQNPDSTARIWDIDISNDGKYIALSMDKAVSDGKGSETQVSNRVEIWDAKDNKFLKVLNENLDTDFKKVKFSNNTEYICIKGFNKYYVYTIPDFLLKSLLDFKESFNGVQAFSFSKDNQRFYSGAHGNIYKYDVNNFELQTIWNSITSPMFIIENTQKNIILTSNYNSHLCVLKLNYSLISEDNIDKIFINNNIIRHELILYNTENFISNYNITNYLGGMVTNGILNGTGSKNITIPFSTYPDGIYFFNTKINNQEYHLKFIKEN